MALNDPYRGKIQETMFSSTTWGREWKMHSMIEYCVMEKRERGQGVDMVKTSVGQHLLIWGVSVQIK